MIYIINMNNIHKESTSRVTSQQQAIYQLIKKTDRHHSAESVHTEIKRVLPRISLATVYRNLEKLAERNMVGRVVIRGKYYFERKTDRHYHVICLSCGRIDNLDSLPASDVESFFSRSTDYKLISHELILFGLCLDCQSAH